MATKCKYPFSEYTTKDKGYNYSKMARYAKKYPTEKQLRLVDGLRKTCERVGVDISGLELATKTRNDVVASIHALYTILGKAGYDGWGNKVKVYNINDVQQTEGDNDV